MCHVPTLPPWALTPRPRLLRSETPSHRHIQREALMANTAHNTGRHELGTKSQPERGRDTSQRGRGARSAASSLPARIRSQTFVASKVLFRGSKTRTSNSGKFLFHSRTETEEFAPTAHGIPNRRSSSHVCPKEAGGQRPRNAPGNVKSNLVGGTRQAFLAF